MGNEKNNITHGYARCSTSEEKQDIDRQVRELKAAGAQKIWLEYEHGDAASKEQQALMLETAKPGDTIIRWRYPVLPAASSSSAILLILCGQASAADHTGQYHDGLPHRSSGSDDRGVFADCRCVCTAGTRHDQSQSKIRHGECQSQGQAYWPAGNNAGFHPGQIHAVLCFVSGAKFIRRRTPRLAGVSRPTVYKYIQLIEKRI